MQDSPLSEVAVKARSSLEALLRAMGFNATVTASEVPNGEIRLRVECEDVGTLIGRHGQVLDALQFILHRLVFRPGEPRRPIVVDAGGYRERRKEALRREVRAAMEHVRRTGSPVRMPPLSALERRWVHHLVAEDPNFQTVSEPAEQGRKCVVIRLKAPAS